MRRVLVWLGASVCLFGGSVGCLWFASVSPVFVDAPGEGEWAQFVVENGPVYAEFEAFLASEGVAGVVPGWWLWGQGTDWRGLEEPSFVVPSRDMWPGIVGTLRVLRDEVIPMVGPVRVVSGFRTEVYNERAGGSKGSRHKFFEAVDVIPIYPQPRSWLHAKLLAFWGTSGEPLRLGLGLYSRLRFHVDTWKYRKW